MSTNEIVLLLISGVLVGIINTLGGGGSVITMSLFMAMGMPIGVANGTNRIAVLLQNLSATVAFLRKGMLHIKSGLLLSIPAILGNILGAMVATEVSEAVFKVCLSVVLVVILIYLVLGKDNETVTGGHGLKIKWWHYIWFFIIGFYGGYIYIGLGFLILAITIWTMNLDIVTANVIKGFVIFLSTPFALAVFIYNNQVEWCAGLLHGVGNIVGAVMASHWAMSWGVKFVRWFTLAIIVVFFADLMGWISLHAMLAYLL
ncbi:MAG: sulfite exporter TauE/SafE family protein [Alistipes sp.]|nr:sulfite exporter TauE/SafE family protein [Alistipes sp.]MBO7263560.1 sulfite exporter TauE/SafE family protein [Alistipes sp.]